MLKDLRVLLRYLTVSGRWLGRRGRIGRWKQVIDLDVWSGPHALRSVHLSHFLPSDSPVQICIDFRDQHDFELPTAERLALLYMTRLIEPLVVFEIGTFTGSTSVTIAGALSSSSVVHTLDLPPGENPHEPRIHEQVGSAFASYDGSGAQIQQHWGDSTTFDFSPWQNKVDMVFIDGSHEYYAVMSDSINAMKMVRPGGMIVWDDYQPRLSGVVCALQELARSYEILHLRGTRLAAMRVP